MSLTSNLQKPKKIAVASCTPSASESAVKVFEAGGNAFDAAVCAAFDLMVSNPLMCSIGGGGFAAVKPAGSDDVKIIDFFDAMPGKGLPKSAFGQNMKTTKLPYGTGIEVISGHSSIGVPGTVKGLEFVSKNYGRIPLSESLKPPAENAIKGVPLNATVAYWLSLSAEKLHWQTEYAKKLLSTEKGEVPPKGYLMKNPDIANTFELIGQYGSGVIYKGDIAKSISDEVLSGGGIITRKDLETYDVIIRNPLKVKYGDYLINTNPPPSVGGSTMVQILKVASKLGIEDYSPENVSKLGRIIYSAFQDRFACFKEGMDYEEKLYNMLSDENILEKYKNISSSSNTTHLCCIDDLGNACSITMSMGYGSGVGIEGTGIVMDNVLGELELNPLGFHALDPGNRLVSSMSPTIAISNNDILALGTPGASRIATSLANIFINIVKCGKDIESALHSPRIHWEDDKFSYEYPLVVNEKLLPNDWEIVKFDKLNMFFGGVQCVQLQNDITLKGASDLRRNGKSIVAG